VGDQPDRIHQGHAAEDGGAESLGSHPVPFSVKWGVAATVGVGVWNQIFPPNAGTAVWRRHRRPHLDGLGINFTAIQFQQSSAPAIALPAPHYS